MKGLTLTQPWATLVAVGQKEIETRSWATRYRGPLAIHAAKGLGGIHRGATEADLRELCSSEPFRSALVTTGAVRAPERDVSELPRGAIVAVAQLVNVVPTDEFIAGANLDRNEFAFGNYEAGRFAWLLEDVRALDEPVPCRGTQILWDVAPEVIARL